MARPHVRTYRPDPRARTTYDRLYDDYVTLHDTFGRGGNDVMKRLRSIRDEAARRPEAVAERV
jgi:L-ribulokinase